MTRKEYENEVREKIFDIKNEFNKKLLELQKELLAEFKEEEPSLDGWKVGDEYFYRNSTGEVFETEVITTPGGDIHNNDIIRITHGYAKHTKEEVQFQVERDAVLYELSKFAEPEDREWDGTEPHCLITWDFWEGGISVKSICTYKGNDIYFSTEEDAEKAIQVVGEQRIAKFYLGVDLNE